MKNLLEKAIYAELNKDPMADALIHQFVVSRCAQINEALRKGKTFVMEDLAGPTIPDDVEITAEELLIDEPGEADDSEDDEDDFLLDDGYNVDTDGDHEISDDEEAAAMEHLRAAIEELEAMFAEDGDEVSTEDEVEEVKPKVSESRRGRKVRESTVITRKSDGEINVVIDAEDGQEADTQEFAEPVADETVVDIDQDTDDLGMDDDETVSKVIPTAESRRLEHRARVIEGRKARAKVAKQK